MVTRTEVSISPIDLQTIHILGVKVNPITVPELHAWMAARIVRGQKARVLHANVHGINLANQNAWLRQTLNEAELVFCDGAGVILGAKILGYSIPQRITYAEWTWELAEFAQEKGFSLFFLGGKPGVAEKAASRLQEKFPRLNILGTHHGYFKKMPGHAENEAVIQKINQAQADILIVGFGMPIQEAWIRENWEATNVTITLSGGAVFDYISGELQRAPQWMTDNGMEWLGRLLIEPRRLWKRYVVGNPLFLTRILWQRVTKRKMPNR